MRICDTHRRGASIITRLLSPHTDAGGPCLARSGRGEGTLYVRRRITARSGSEADRLRPTKHAARGELPTHSRPRAGRAGEYGLIHLMKTETFTGNPSYSIAAYSLLEDARSLLEDARLGVVAVTGENFADAGQRLSYRVSYTVVMADTITFRPDEDTSKALEVLTKDGTPVSAAVRTALIDAARRKARAAIRAEAERLAEDESDRAEAMQVLRDMETLRAW
jgi:hypothetical protein